MDHVVSEWKNADRQVLETYERFTRLSLYGTIFLVVLLALMALFLL